MVSHDCAASARLNSPETADFFFFFTPKLLRNRHLGGGVTIRKSVYKLNGTRTGAPGTNHTDHASNNIRGALGFLHPRGNTSSLRAVATEPVFGQPHPRSTKRFSSPPRVVAPGQTTPSPHSLALILALQLACVFRPFGSLHGFCPATGETPAQLEAWIPVSWLMAHPGGPMARPALQSGDGSD